METILHDFGIQPVLLAAQVVNFLVLLFLLKKFLYKPILKVLDDRKKRIAQSLKDAAEIEARLQKTVAEQEKIIAKATKEAQQIVDGATKSADQIIKEAQEKASEEMEEMMTNAKLALANEKEKLSQEVRAEAANLIALGIEKVLGKKQK